MYYVTMQITFLTRKFRNGERNLHCDVVHITTKWVSSLTLDCNGVFAIKAYTIPMHITRPRPTYICPTTNSVKRFERSNGLDTALYKNYLYLFYNTFAVNRGT